MHGVGYTATSSDNLQPSDLVAWIETWLVFSSLGMLCMCHQQAISIDPSPACTCVKQGTGNARKAARQSVQVGGLPTCMTGGKQAGTKPRSSPQISMSLAAIRAGRVRSA
jgi:hypothetical protein